VTACLWHRTNESSIHTIGDKEREVRSVFSAALETAKMVSLIRDKTLSKTKKSVDYLVRRHVRRRR
jgi:hypothetical protein